jgi:hypothetical protein
MGKVERSELEQIIAADYAEMVNTDVESIMARDISTIISSNSKHSHDGDEDDDFEDYED